MKLVRSAHLCHVFKYSSDTHIKKKKGKDKEIQIVNRKENMITLLSCFPGIFQLNIYSLRGSQRYDSYLEPITVKQTMRYNIVCSSIQAKVYRSFNQIHFHHAILVFYEYYSFLLTSLMHSFCSKLQRYVKQLKKKQKTKETVNKTK